MLEGSKLEKPHLKLNSLKLLSHLWLLPASVKKKYIPCLPAIQSEDSLPVFLGCFSESMKAAQILTSQWVARLRDILTGKVLRAFQDLSETDKASYDTTR